MPIYDLSGILESVKSFGKKEAEVSRFKGLGEISPKEFGQFIGDGIRLVQVSVGSMGEVEKSLDFFMGKNTPQRRDFIVENLTTDVL